MTTSLWGFVLTAAAVIAIGLQVRHLRAARVTSLQFSAGLVARIGFLFLGILYASGLVYRWPKAPLLGLGIVGGGIVLNLLAGVIENIRRVRSPRTGPDDE